MKETIKKSIIGGITFFVTVSILGVVYALSFPATPSGQITGGNFMNYFNKMLVNTGSSTDGTVKVSNDSNKLGGKLPSYYLNTGSIIPSSNIIESDPQVGTLTSGKWCTNDGAKINCTSDTPSGGIVNLSGIPNSLTLYKWGVSNTYDCRDFLTSYFDYSLVNAPFYSTDYFFGHPLYFSYNCNQIAYADFYEVRLIGGALYTVYRYKFGVEDYCNARTKMIKEYGYNLSNGNIIYIGTLQAPYETYANCG